MGCHGVVEQLDERLASFARAESGVRLRLGQLLEVVREIHSRGTTIVIVEQSVNVALNLAERAVFMEKGEVRFSGPTSDLLDRPDILRSVFIAGRR